MAAAAVKLIFWPLSSGFWLLVTGSWLLVSGSASSKKPGASGQV